jgi:hypothetical protein
VSSVPAVLSDTRRMAAVGGLARVPSSAVHLAFMTTLASLPWHRTSSSVGFPAGHMVA